MGKAHTPEEHPGSNRPLTPRGEKRKAETIRAIMVFFYMWKSFAEPFMAGAIYDRAQSYVMALWIMLGRLTVATLLVLFLIWPWRIRMTAMNQDPG